MLVKDIATLKSFLAAPAASGLKWESIRPLIKRAEIKYLAPAIGPELYQLISEAYDTTSPSLSAAETLLLPYLQAPVALLATYLYSFESDVTLGEAGIQRQETANSKTAYKEQRQALRESLLDSGYEAIEDLLVYVEKHASDFSAWQDSDARTAANELLIRSGRELKQYYSPLRQPQRTYMAMLSMIRTVEDLTLTGALGDTYATLKATDQAGDATILEATVIKTIKKSLAHLSISKGLLQLDIRLDDAGTSQLTTHVDTTRGEDSNRSQANSKKTEALARQCEDIGLSYLQAAVKYLNTNASSTVFPTWYTQLQAAAEEAQPPADINSTLSGSFSL